MAKSALFVTKSERLAIDLRRVTHIDFEDNRYDNPVKVYFDSAVTFAVDRQIGQQILEAWKKYHESLMSMDALLDAAHNGKALNDS